MSLTKLFLFLFSLIVLLSCTKSEYDSDVLMNIQDFKDIQNSSEAYTLIDLRPHSLYTEGHIPKAINIHRKEFENPNFPIVGMAMDKAALEGMLSEKGVDNNHKIILYDDKGGVEASRLWWMLTMFGQTNVFLLNGGLHSWDGFLKRGNENNSATKFQFSGLTNRDMTITYNDFEKLRKSKSIVILDNRSKDEYDGIVLKKGATYAGHIPGAKNICYTNTIDLRPNQKMTIKSKKELEKIFSIYAAKEDTVLLYCHSGVRSAHTYLVMSELLGYKHVYNYDGSWIEWSLRNSENQTAKK